MVCTEADTDLTSGFSGRIFRLSDTAYRTSVGERRISVSVMHVRDGDARRGGEDLWRSWGPAVKR
jgi:hypothetical protein